MIDIENVKLDYQPGNAPQASAKRTGTNQDKYDILFECWEKQEKDADDTMHTVGYWYSDEAFIRTTMFDSTPLKRAEGIYIP